MKGLQLFALTLQNGGKKLSGMHTVVATPAVKVEWPPLFSKYMHHFKTSAHHFARSANSSHKVT
jgi:hypothetical protein